MPKNLIVYDQDPIFIEYISNELGVNYRQENSRTVSHVRQNDDGTYTLLAVVLFDHFTEHHVELSVASSSKHWATWNFLHACYEFGFSRKEVRLNMVVEASNTDALNMHKKLGHKQEGYLRDWFGENKDAYLFALTKKDYLESRWYKKRNS